MNPQTGYGQISLNAGEREVLGMNRVATVPVIACTMAHGPRPRGLQVLHSCDTKNCGNPRHLRWGTQAENNREAWDRGRQLRGERHHQARYSDRTVEGLRMLVEGGMPVKHAAARLGVNVWTAYAWVRGASR